MLVNSQNLNTINASGRIPGENPDSGQVSSVNPPKHKTPKLPFLII